jgi:hypothetical protein
VGCRQQCAHGIDDRFRLGVQSSMRHTQDAVTGELQSCVFDPVAFECCSRQMELTTVELDRETAVRPHGVDLEAFDDDVEERTRQRSVAAEVEKIPLEVGARSGWRFEAVRQCRQRGSPTPSVTAIQELMDGAKVEQLEPLGGLEGALEQSRARRRDVEQRLWDGGDGNAMSHRQISRV